MKAYNIYYKNEKLNSKPLDYSEVIKLVNKPSFIKSIDENGSFDIKKLKIIKCTIL